ncbi:universal stress protein [Streptomyces sp. NPDC058297]|uniref:universal stress protein n=1 Tax=Streptomyces sp. NPDC058297 TaxID=3346433 RepID=UPI0036E23FF6
MSPTVTVGLDGSPESRAAAEWAAHEAKLRGLPLKVIHVWEPDPVPMAQAPLLGVETCQDWSERVPHEAAEGIRARHPGVEVIVEQRRGQPAEVLSDAAPDAVLLALGSRGLGGMGGFVVGSVGLAVVARTDRPVVLVRAEEQAADEHMTDPSGIPSASAPFLPVVLGLDTASPDEDLIAFAFEEARLRDTPLHVVHSWDLPPYIAYGLAADLAESARLLDEEAAAVTEVLRPWRQNFATVKVTEDSRSGKAPDYLVEASRHASLVVVGRRGRRSVLGTHIGPVTHAVLHHAAAPVAVVPHE